MGGRGAGLEGGDAVLGERAVLRGLADPGQLLRHLVVRVSGFRVGSGFRFLGR